MVNVIFICTETDSTFCQPVKLTSILVPFNKNNNSTFFLIKGNLRKTLTYI